jgi:hypothetical protein
MTAYSISNDKFPLYLVIVKKIAFGRIEIENQGPHYSIEGENTTNQHQFENLIVSIFKY